MSERVPMPAKRGGWVHDEDMAVSLKPNFPVGQRFSMDINEAVLRQLGARALEHAAERLGQHVAHEHIGDIQQAVDRYLFDGSWVKPIIEEEIRRAAREFVLALWSDDEKKAMRDWFDLFTATIRGSSPGEPPQ